MANSETGVTVIDYSPKTIEIPQLDPSEYNLLIRGRTVIQSNPFLKPVVREVTLDHPDDVYPITKKKVGDRWVATELGISKVGLDTLADKASILDVPQASGRADDGRDPNLVTYRSTIAMRMPDGEVVVRTRESTVKLSTLEKEIRTQKTAKAKEYEWSKDRLEAEIAKELLLKEKFMERLAESGAHNRAVKAILGLRSKYTPEEIARPFVFMAVVPDMEQPELRARALDQAMSLASSLFGPSGGQGTAPRQLTAGPAPEAIATAIAESEGGELGEDEIEGATFRDESEDPAPATPTVLPGEKLSRAAVSDDDPAWITGITTDGSDAQDDDSGMVDIVEALREAAAASGMKGALTEPQKAQIGPLLAPLNGTGAFGLVVREAFGPEAVQAASAAQGQAIINVAGRFDAPELFLAAWAATADGLRTAGT